jgi:hypothetical protein
MSILESAGHSRRLGISIGGRGPDVAADEALSRAARRKRAISHGLFGFVPLIFTAFVLYVAIRSRAFAVDFHNGEWPAGVRLLDGASPYYGPHSAAVLSAGAAHPKVTPFVYPAVGAVMYGALALIPHYLADALFTAFDMAAALLALRLMGVRDSRLYGLVFLWPPVMIGWQTANITLLLGLGVAAVWYYRDRPSLSGPLLALVISVKIVMWPLALWLLATRRYRALAYTVGCGLIMNLAAWAVVGYNAIPRYLSVLQSFNHAGERRAYSVINLALHLGADPKVATALSYLIAAVIAVACLRAGSAGRERLALVLCLAVALLATPIIWLHYFALLLVPLALIRPRLGVAWFLPLVMFGCPPTEPTTWQIVLVLAIATTLIALMVRSESEARTRPFRRWRSFPKSGGRPRYQAANSR